MNLGLFNPCFRLLTRPFLCIVHDIRVEKRGVRAMQTKKPPIC